MAFGGEVGQPRPTKFSYYKAGCVVIHARHLGSGSMRKAQRLEVNARFTHTVMVYGSTLVETPYHAGRWSNRANAVGHAAFPSEGLSLGSHF